MLAAVKKMLAFDTFQNVFGSGPRSPDSKRANQQLEKQLFVTNVNNVNNVNNIIDLNNVNNVNNDTNDTNDIITSKNVLPVNQIVEVPFDTSALDRTNTWKTWRYLTEREISKFDIWKYFADGLSLQIVPMSHGKLQWTIYLRDESTYAYKLEVTDEDNIMATFAFPNFLYADFIKNYPQYALKQDVYHAKTLRNNEITDEVEQEFVRFDNIYTKQWTPSNWGANLPMKYWNKEENIPWANNIHRFAMEATEINHIYGNVYDLVFNRGYDDPVDGNGHSSTRKKNVKITSRVDKRTGKIFRVNYKDEGNFDGEIGDNNQLKVKTDTITPDNFVYGFKVAKTKEGVPCIVKLMIPKTSKIACAVNDWKVRTDKAWVTGIWEIQYDKNDNTITYGPQVPTARSFYYQEHVADHSTPDFYYETGELCAVNDFEPRLDRVCVPGIHFYFSQRILINLSVYDVFRWNHQSPKIVNEDDINGAIFESRADKLAKALIL